MMYNGSFRVQTSNGTVSYPISKHKPSGEYYGVGGGYIPTKSDSDQFKVQMDTGGKSLKDELVVRGPIDDFGDGKLQNRDVFSSSALPSPDDESEYITYPVDWNDAVTTTTSRIEWGSVSGNYSFSNNNLVVNGGDSLQLSFDMSNPGDPVPVIGVESDMANWTGYFEMKVMGDNGQGMAFRYTNDAINAVSYYNGSQTAMSSSGAGSGYDGNYYLGTEVGYITCRSDGQILADVEHQDGSGNAVDVNFGTTTTFSLDIQPDSTREFSTYGIFVV